jgi:uncharacterized protein YcnI
MMRKNITKFLQILGISVGISLFATTQVTAHVVVRPAEVKTASFTTFTIGVPVEKDIPTTSLKLLIPEGLQYVTPTLKTGWFVSAEKEPIEEGTGHSDAKVTSITWSGNTIPAGFRDEFTFSAKVPEAATQLEWKAYQTYADGTVVAWDKTETEQPKNEAGEPDFSAAGPFSVTKIVTETEGEIAQKRTEQAAGDADESADRAFYIGIAASVLSLVAIGLAFRKK